MVLPEVKMLMPSKNILEDFMDKKELSILRLFLFSGEERFYLREISKKTRVSGATTFRIVRKLKALGLVQETLIKKTKLYSLLKSKSSAFLSDLFEEKKPIVEEFLETVRLAPGVETVLQHGEDQKGKIEVIVIGSGVDKKVINEKVGEIKYKYDFTIIPTIVNSQEFARLVITGGVSQKTTILWERPTTNL
ncbi:hypothetical protein JW826_04870 [Candidatus Woesearchaeota archaeon]|nr:hypothetical protein [Candidatus Woesearchaeota archaeon]